MSGIVLVMQVSVGDVVFRGEAAGIVLACVADGETLVAIVDVLSCVGKLSPHSASWALAAAREVWLAAHLESAMGWYEEPGGATIVLRY